MAQAQYEQILYERRNRVALVTLNRPERLNAWTDQMENEFLDALSQANADLRVGAIVVTGAGRGFCAGADITHWAQRQAGEQGGSPAPSPIPTEQIASQEVPIALTASKPVIAAINGVAIGIGLTLTLSCDVRIAASTARLSARFVRVGINPECGSTRYLPLVAGLPNALLLALTGRIVDAEEAQARRLLERVVPPERLLDEALALADEIAANPLDAVWMAKRLLHQNAAEPDLRRVVTVESLTLRQLRRLPAHREATVAFLEKREPRFHPPAD